MTEEQEEKYVNFLDKVSEILGLNKPVDVLRLCAVTDEYLRPIEKHIAELEKENAELRLIADFQTSSNMDRYFQLKRSKEQLTKAKDIIRDYKIVVEGDHTTVCSVPEENRCINVLKLNEQAEQFLKEASE
jgi:hypothetical protein